MVGSESPSPGAHPAPDSFFVGMDSHGNWVVQDAGHRRGGLFVDRAAALKFAKSESGDHPLTVVMVPEPFELDMSGTAGPAKSVASDNAQAYRRAA
jgi:hypothetical protein